MLYEINTRVVLAERARRLGRSATLDDLPDDFLDDVRAKGFTWAWLLGVWQTGAAGRSVSRTRREWREGFRSSLPDLREEDIAGSPFAVQAYSVHADFGGDAALARLRARLARRGLRLMLDFVPNHTACDHPWTQLHPEYYVHGTEADLAREPDNYARVGAAGVLAHGRDPNLAGWPDTLQLNHRHEGLRKAMLDELRGIASRCDGVRCDMAMLLLPEVIERTWGERSRPADGSRPVGSAFWSLAIEAVRRDHPEFLFMAEVYWDLEEQLQQLGFDFTYDKRLYDRLRSGMAGAVRESLRAPVSFQDRSVRFLENHDEARAATAFAPDAHRAAAVVAYLLPGLRLFHEGQLEGRKVHVSMHLGRRPEEPLDVQLRDFYRRLLACLRRPEARGRWRWSERRPAWPGNESFDGFMTFTWEGEAGRALLVAVNFAPTRGQCFAPVQLPGLGHRQVTLVDLLSDARYERAGDDLETRGLYLDLPGWGRHVFEVS
jgi:Alpha amylase, catalytic domain